MKKIAIRVNNKREFDYLMKHYESKGWRAWSNKLPTITEWPTPTFITFEDRFEGYANGKYSDFEQVIDFSTFAQIAGIEVVNEVKISLNKGLAIVKQNAVYFEGNPCDFNLSGRHLEEIYAAYKSLQ